MAQVKQTEVSERRPFGRRMGRFFRNLLIIFILLGAFAIYWFFYNRYGYGERRGTLIKVTRRGDIFKTNEGEIWLSCRNMVNPEKFYFSVTNDSLANYLTTLQDECVQVRYAQFRGALPWRGDSRCI